MVAPSWQYSSCLFTSITTYSLAISTQAALARDPDDRYEVAIAGATTWRGEKAGGWPAALACSATAVARPTDAPVARVAAATRLLADATTPTTAPNKNWI